MNGADKFARDAFGNDAEYYFTHEFTKPAAQMGKRSSINDISEGASTRLNMLFSLKAAQMHKC